MTTSTIPARLRAACRGHPAAQIPWPHRLLHEAADRIEELEAAIAAAKHTPNGDQVKG